MIQSFIGHNRPVFTGGPAPPEVPAWVTANICLAMVIVPCPWPDPRLAATDVAPIPLPVQPATDVTVSHPVSLATAEAQPAPAVTRTLPEPPAVLIDAAVGLIA